MSRLVHRFPSVGWLELFAGLFGLFLGVALLKFGNPPVMEKWTEAPSGFWEILSTGPWPLSWAYALLGGVAMVGGWACVQNHGEESVSASNGGRSRWGRGLALLPLVWLGWQMLAGLWSVDSSLTAACLKHFAACAGCFYLGFFGLNRVRSGWIFWSGLIGGSVLMLAIGWQQHFGGLEATRRYFYLYIYPQMKDVSPEYLKKIASNRIFSTLFYPNALAGALLLLLPILPMALKQGQKRLGTLPGRAQLAVIGTVVLASLCFGVSGLGIGGGVLLFLGLAFVCPVFKSVPCWLLWVAVGLAGLPCLVWSGSKGGWLLMLVLGLAALMRLPMRTRSRLFLVLAILVVGLAGLGIRHRVFFQKGATSVSARFDYWQAAVQTVTEHPWVGTGPGTFGVAYQKLRRPGSEPSRLTHNDYLEQASDSGLPGFVIFAVFVLGSLSFCLKNRVLEGETGRIQREGQDSLVRGEEAVPKRGHSKTAGNWGEFVVWLGLFGWFLHSFIEFGLYIPATAWIAFSLLGWLLGGGTNLIDKSSSKT